MKRLHAKIDLVRKAYHAEPFVPFVLRLSNGREVRVRERGFMMFPPNSRTIVVYDTDEACSIIDVALVADVELKSAARKRRRA